MQGDQGTQGIQGETGAKGDQGDAGINGKSAYQIYTENNTDPDLSELNWLASLKGETGLTGFDGRSAYEVWLDLGNIGTESDFIASLAGPQGSVGADGIDGKNTLVITTTEPAGSNCANGGTKIEIGLDNNNNSILDLGEINSSLTKYICNGTRNGNLTSTVHGVLTLVTNQESTWTVPDGVFSLNITLMSSNGGSSGYICGSPTICNFPQSKGIGGQYGSANFNFSVFPGQVFILHVGENGIDGENSVSSCFAGTPGTDGTDSYISLDSVELIRCTGGKGGTSAAVGVNCTAPSAGTSGANGSVQYLAGSGLLNLQSGNNLSFYGLNGPNKIRIEY